MTKYDIKLLNEVSVTKNNICLNHYFSKIHIVLHGFKIKHNAYNGFRLFRFLYTLDPFNRSTFSFPYQGDSKKALRTHAILNVFFIFSLHKLYGRNEIKKKKTHKYIFISNQRYQDYICVYVYLKIRMYSVRCFKCFLNKPL